MIRENRKILLPLLVAFVVINALLTIFKTFFEKNGFDREFLLLANLFFFMLSLAAFLLQRRGLQSDNPNVFVRRVYSSVFLKLFVCIIAVTIYAFIKTTSINRSAIFFSMGLYITYTSIEVAALMKVAKGTSNAKKRITS